MMMHFLADTLPPRSRYDNDGMCAVVDPCTDPEALRTLLEEKMQDVRCRSDLADQETHGSLMTALADRSERSVREMHVIEF